VGLMGGAIGSTVVVTGSTVVVTGSTVVVTGSADGASVVPTVVAPAWWAELRSRNRTTAASVPTNPTHRPKRALLASRRTARVVPSAHHFKRTPHVLECANGSWNPGGTGASSPRRTWLNVTLRLKSRGTPGS